MKKKIELHEGKLTHTFEFTMEHQRALAIILANDGVCEFENREPSTHEDVDGNEISWQICDELVEMGLLDEDIEAFDVYFELNKHGRNLVMNLNHDLDVERAV